MSRLRLISSIFFLSQSSGSGSESGTQSQTQKSVKSKSAEKSDNNSGSNDEEDSGSPALNFGDGSDHGSGTQVMRFIVFCFLSVLLLIVGAWFVI